MSDPPTGLSARLLIGADQARRSVPASRLRFRTTAEIPPLRGAVGQTRAHDALDYGLDARDRMNVFVAGEPGSGRRTMVADSVAPRASARPVPDDWVYLHDFAEPDRPKALRLPAGTASELSKRLRDFVDAALREIPRAMETEEYELRQREILEDVNRRRQELEQELADFATARDVALQPMPAGVASIPMRDGKPLTTEEFARLPEEERRRIDEAGSAVEGMVATHMHRLHQLAKEAAERMAGLDREVAEYAVAGPFRDVEDRFHDHPAVVAHAAAVREEIITHLAELRGGKGTSLPMPVDPRTRLGVNVFVDNGQLNGAPVVAEPNPTYYNLFGRLDYRATFGAMVTDFTQIKPGAVHRANGGYLVLDALEVLRHPFSWEALKRALRNREARIENLGEEFSAVPTATLRPEAIPLEVKVVLVGSAATYRLFYSLDREFRELFKVKAEFAADVAWDAGHERALAGFIARWVRDHELPHLDRAAVARVIEHAARVQGDQRRLTARLSELGDVVTEAAHWSRRAAHPLVREEDVKRAVRQREYRSNLIEERAREMIDQGVIVIGTSGARIGEVNGLSIVDLGDYRFGIPSRISARVALGRDGVESIEREIDLSGPIHSKGVMILSGYLRATFGQGAPLALGATLTFEQGYGEVEGDSASSTELYALLSALAGVQISRQVAVTGSIDQHGRVQAVGGVTEKVEGFYATCKARGLQDGNGVIIPRANVRNLMLDDDVVEAVRNGQFRIWAVEHVDQGIEILTGMPAGRARRSGAFPPESVNGRAAATLARYADAARDFATQSETDSR